MCFIDFHAIFILCQEKNLIRLIGCPFCPLDKLQESRMQNLIYLPDLYYAKDARFVTIM